MNSKEIELVLQARLEEGDALSRAENLGKSIADSMLLAFDDLGRKIAEKLFVEFQQYFANQSMAGAMFQMSGTGMPQIPLAPQASQQALGLVDHTGAPYAAIQARITHDNAPVGRPETAPTAAPPQGPVGIPHTQPNDPISHYLTKQKNPTWAGVPIRTLAGVGGSLEKDTIEDYPKVYANFKALDKTLDSYRLNRRLEALGGGHQMSQEEFDGVGKAISEAVKSLSSVSKEILALKDNIDHLSESVSKNRAELAEMDRQVEQAPEASRSSLREQQKARREELLTSIKTDQVNLDEARRQQAENTDTLNSVSEANNAYKKDQAARMSIRNQGLANRLALTGIGFRAAGHLVDLGVNAEMGLQRHAAYSQAIEGNTTRDIMSGDISNVLATQALGGDAALESRSRLSTYAGLASKSLLGVGGIITGSAMVAGAGGLGAITAPFTAGLSAVPAALAAGTGASIAGASASLLKDTVMEGINSEQRVHAQMQERKAIELLKEKEAMTSVSAARSTMMQSFATAQSVGAPELAETISGRNGVRAALMNSGLSKEQQDSFLANMGASMGGSTLYSNIPTLQGSPGELALLGHMKGTGFASAEATAAGFYEGTERGNNAGAMKQAFEAYTTLNISGMDRSRINPILQGEAARAASMGAGGMEASVYELDAASRAGMMVSRTGKADDRVMSGILHMNEGMRDATRSQSGIGATAGWDAVQKFMGRHKELGKISISDQALMHNRNVDAEFISQISGGKVTGEAAENLASEFMKQRKDSLQDMYSKVGGSEYAKMRMAEEFIDPNMSAGQARTVLAGGKLSDNAGKGVITPGSSTVAQQKILDKDKGSDAREIVNQTASASTAAVVAGFGSLTTTTGLLNKIMNDYADTLKRKNDELNKTLTSFPTAKAK